MTLALSCLMSSFVKGFGRRPPELAAPSVAAGIRNPSQMQLVAAHVLETRRIRGSSEKRREVLDPLHVVMLGLRRKLADRHVFDHALPQRAYGLVGHGDAPALSEVVEPLDLKTGRPVTLSSWLCRLPQRPTARAV